MNVKMQILPLLAAVLAASLPVFDAPLRAAPARSARTAGGKQGAAKKNEPRTNVSSDILSRAARKATNATFAPERTSPVQRGEFQVDLVVIAFPDCFPPESPETVLESLSKVDGGTVTEYYKDYSQGITWPVLAVYPAVYNAPEPLGYYCRWNQLSNPLGFKGEDGHLRAAKLRADALRFVQSKGRLQKKGVYTCYVYCTTQNPDEALREKLIRPHYGPKPTPDEIVRGAYDKIGLYNPPIPWADPLWPNSIPQVKYPADGRTLVHELGHCLGAPDFYHASEEHDGLEGSPCLPWSFGPTGPAYCRYIYHAFVPAAAYPRIAEPGEVTLAPRSTTFAADAGASAHPLGVFVPSSHPNYLFYLEYCHKERRPVGDPSAQGLLVHLINVTMTSPMMGPPDMCYTYRANDPDFKGIGEGGTYLRPGDSFDEKSDPAAVLPNFLPAGIAVSDIRENDDGTCSFKLAFPQAKLTKQDLDHALLPQTEMVEVDGLLPTSLHAEMNVRYRGEPLLEEYGFCYGTKKGPSEKTGSLFPLYHRDRYDARIIDLKPGTTYHVRAYARSASGIRYSDDEKVVKLPLMTEGRPTATLFSPSDHLLSNWYIQQWYFASRDNVFNSANPHFAFMALANYYRALPGSAANAKASGPFDMKRVHSNPSDTRPKFRLVETDKLRFALIDTLAKAGITQPDFKKPGGKDSGKKKPQPPKRAAGRPGKGPFYGDNTAWVQNAASVLKVKNPEKVFFSCKTEEEIANLAPEVKKSILLSEPVLVIRENKPMTDELSVRWPLDVAIIDGLGPDDDSFHVVFPGGADRGRKGADGVVKLSSLLERTTDAMMLFYRPGPPGPIQRK